MLVATLLATTALAEPVSGRRAAIVGLGASFLRPPAFAASEECLSCRLKDSIAAGGASSGLAIGTDIGALLAPKLAVTDVVDVGRDPSKFDETMQKTLAKYDPSKVRVLVWVQSELVNGVPWCPDTRAAIPLLESALYRATGPPIVLVNADVARREYADSSYLYRQHPELRLRGVPTLYRWGRQGPVARLQEGQLTPAALDELIRA